MVITEIQNKDEAEIFINSLKHFRESLVTDKPYAVHMLFLVTGLEIESANLLLDALKEIDKVSGAYIACHIFIDRIEIPIYETLTGTYTRKPIKNNKLSVNQIEGICSKGELDHVQMKKLKATNLTYANELVAKQLGIVDKVPCVVIFDSVEVVAKGQYSIISFPKDRIELSKMLRGILGIIGGGNAKNNSLILDSIHNLYDKKKNLKTKLGAPLAHKKEVLKKVLSNISSNLSSAKFELNRVSKKLSINHGLDDKKLNILVDSIFITSKSEIESISEDKLSLLLLDYNNYVYHSISEDEINDTIENKLLSLKKSINIEIENVLKKIEIDHNLIQDEIAKVQLDLDSQINNLKQCSSIVGAIRRNKFLTTSITTGKESISDLLKSSIKDLAKPTFWIKLFLS